MKLQKAFTLAELLIVVAGMAMLAAAAVPRFHAVNQEIRASAVESLAVNVQSSADLTNRIWLSNGRPARLTVDGQPLEMRHGFPTEDSISEIVVNSGDFVFSDGYFKHRDLMSTTGCGVLYIPPSSQGSGPVVSSNTDGC
jgi:type II secretory pathway pseudopilin PulG